MKKLMIISTVIAATLGLLWFLSKKGEKNAAAFCDEEFSDEV
ncbi:hypothetical protein [Ruminococcus sp.]|nr:hypothetical protein [Ruminococcus sp.]